MGRIGSPRPVMLICGILAAEGEWIEQAESRLVDAFGPIALLSPVWSFEFTDYYAAEMGPGLRRRFLTFSDLIDPGALPDAKLRTNAIEDACASADGKRRVNLDPGYLTPHSLVLASTKNFAHRIYLREGIYAEVTLKLGRGRCVTFDWTYRDFASGRYDAFLLKARRNLMESLEREPDYSSSKPSRRRM